MKNKTIIFSNNQNSWLCTPSRTQFFKVWFVSSFFMPHLRFCVSQEENNCDTETGCRTSRTQLQTKKKDITQLKKCKHQNFLTAQHWVFIPFFWGIFIPFIFFSDIIFFCWFDKSFKQYCAHQKRLHLEFKQLEKKMIGFH